MELIINSPMDKNKKNPPQKLTSESSKEANKKTKKNYVPNTPTHHYSKYPPPLLRSKNSKSENYIINSPSDEDEDNEEEEDEEEENDENWVSENEEEEEEQPLSPKKKSERKIKNNKKQSNYVNDEDNMFDKKGQLDQKKYTNLLSSLFPSKYIQEKSTKYKNKLPVSPIYFPSKKKHYNKEEEEEEEEEEEDDDEEEDIGSDDTDDDEEEEDDEEEDNYKNRKNKKEKLSKMLKNGSKFNIIFTLGSAGIGKKGKKYDYDEEYDSDEDEDYDSEDDEEYDSDEEDDDDDEYSEEEEESEDEEGEESENEDSELDDVTSYAKMKEMISALPEKEQNSSMIKKVMATLEKNKKKQEEKIKQMKKKKIKKNTKCFKKMLREKNVMNDVRFFKDKMTPEQQTVVIKQLEEITKYSEVDKPYRLALIDSQIPIAYKSCAIKKINSLRYMDPGAGEYYKIKNWVDTFMQIPFGQHKILPITINDGVDQCHEFMANAKKILDEAVYGLNDAKLQIMQMVGQWLVNPNAIGTAIAIKGPMGTGKTTLVKEGISKILGRDFAFIALGGATDSSFLEGHSYTYEGSSWGKIVDILIQCKSMNPVIYFDELDKVSDTPKGEEIIGILTHLTDTSQNSKFHDKYFAGIDFDLSRCLFIFSYNDESKVNPILRDRMYRIHTKGYDLPQKTIISNQHLLPKIREQVAFKTDEIIIPDETLHSLINNHTEKEDGVRNLKRCLEIIHTKLNLYRLMKPGTNLFDKDDNMSLTVHFPITVTPDIVDKLIKKSTETGAWTGMYS